MSFKSQGPRLFSAKIAKKTASLKLGLVFEAEVSALTDTGEGLVIHPNGCRVFVAGVWPGERVRLTITLAKSQFAQAKLTELLTPSPERVTPVCPYQGVDKHQCGGCGWMFVNYAAQLQAKQLRAATAVARLDKSFKINSIWASPNTLEYRTRAQFKTDGTQLGFVANGQHALVPVADCVVLTPHNRQVLQALNARLPVADWSPDLSSKTRAPVDIPHWTTLDIDESVNASSVSVNQRLPFQQANAEQNQAMRQWLQQRLMSKARDLSVLELFAGSGNFTQILAADGFSQITAVESSAEAVATLNALQLPGVTSLVSNLFDEIALRALLQTLPAPKILVLDPPREGLKCRTPFLEKKSSITDIVYISCDLATLCRDLQDFIKVGYKLKAVQPVDLFPQTPHLEMLVHLQRNRA